MILFRAILLLNIMSGESPIYNTTDFPKLKLIEDNWQILASEIPPFDINKKYPRRDNRFPLHMSEAELDKIAEDYVGGCWFESWDGNHIWFSFPFVYMDKIVKQNSPYCPRSLDIIKQLMVDTNIAIAGYSLLIPHSRIVPHTDGKKENDLMATNMLLTDNTRAHLWVDSQQFHHQQGKMMIFDPTKIHTALNDDDTPRVVFSLDFKRTYVPNLIKFY
jgi:aspartyl/asparaginyl beta-hydroxylase (cupin superfamily)